MPDTYPRTQIRAIAADRGLVGGPFGSNLGRKDYLSSGVPVIRGTNMTGRFIDLADSVYVSPTKASTDLRGNWVAPGDIVVTQRGTLGQVSMLPFDAPSSVLSQSQMRLRVEASAVDALFTLYAMLDSNFQHQIQSNAIASGVPHINLGLLASFEVPMPPLAVQRSIAATIGALDDLIDTDRWLAEVCHRSSIAIVAAACATGARRLPVGEAAAFENRQRIPLSANERAAMPGHFPYYGATGQMGTVGKFLFDGTRVLVGEDGTVVRNDGSPVVQLVSGRYWVNNHAHVLRGTACSTALLRIALERTSVVGAVTGAVQAKLSMGNLRSVALTLPADPEIDHAVGGLAGAEQALLGEAGQLVRTRDELLPLLMSGRVIPGEVAS